MDEQVQLSPELTTLLEEHHGEPVPIIPWEEFLITHFRWRQDEHVGLIGPTGSGKSTLLFSILPKRKYVAFFATKPQDPTLTQYAKANGFQHFKEWPDSHVSRNPFKKTVTPQQAPRRIIWPDARSISSTHNQHRVFSHAVNDIYESGGWCMVWDEFSLMCNTLKLQDHAKLILQQGRSNNISFVAGAQRPSKIPLELYDQSTHLFFWRDNDESNLERMSGIGWRSAKLIRSLVADLEPHQFLYINTRTGDMLRSKAEVNG